MEEYLIETLGFQVECKGKYDVQNLPRFYSSKYEMCLYAIDRLEFLVVMPLDKDMNLLQLKKHFLKITDASKLQCVLYLQAVTPYQRKSLIEQGIPFVIEGTQIYLPFLGIVLSEKYKPIIKAPKKMSPSTQFVFLFMYYHYFENIEKESFSLPELSEKLELSAMTISRAVSDLDAIGLVETHLKGRTKYISFGLQRHEFLHQGLKYFQNPVAKRYYVSTDKDLSICGWESGISAISEVTMIAEGRNDKCIGFYSLDNRDRIVNEIPHSEKLSFYEYVTIEEWKYDVKKLELKDDFDYVSIIFMLESQEIHDERVLLALNDLKERVGW